MHAYINVGDCGSDQSAFRSHLRTELDKPDYGDRIILVCCPCLKHQYHLIAQGQLRLVDRVLKIIWNNNPQAQASNKAIKYFSGLATMGHTWRSHLSKIRKAGETLGMLNKNVLFRIPPLAIAGRWGSIDSQLAKLATLSSFSTSVSHYVKSMSVLVLGVRLCHMSYISLCVSLSLL